MANLIPKRGDIPAKEHYRLLYQSNLDLEAEWLRRGAIAKVNSIQSLLLKMQIAPKSMVELGCGTGAVIRECQGRAMFEPYLAMDYSSEAIDYLKKRSEGIGTMVADITSADFMLPEVTDLVVLSHVLEHIEDPAAFLASIIRKISFSYLFVEVPLEDLAIARLKELYRDRRDNITGHVQFFTRNSLANLIRSCGLTICNERFFAPILDVDTVRFITAKSGLGELGYLRSL